MTDMAQTDILALIGTAEQTNVQFKERITRNNKYNVSCEMVALSNSHGGKIVVGIKDSEGQANPLSYNEVQETTNLLGDLSSEGVVPSILIDIENISIEGGVIVVATIKEGMNKPYRDNKGVIWVKQGANKRKVFDNTELSEMMSECGNFDPDMASVREATIDDLDEATIKEYLRNRFSLVLERKGLIGDKFNNSSISEVCNAIAEGHDLSKLLRNLRFIRSNGQLTVAAILLFGRYTQRWLPTMTAKCISFLGNDVGSTQFRDKVKEEEIEGNLLHQFDVIMSFLVRNLRKVQVSDEFNSEGQLEIPYSSLLELIVNALVHRSLNWSAPIRIFLFDNRLEIHSPGTLPNGLSVKDILAGTSMPRNTFLFSNAIFLLPYTGAGSGIQRTLGDGLNVQFDNNEATHEFIVTILRESNHQIGESNHQSNHQKANLTPQQIDICNFCTVPRSSQEIMDRLGITNQSKNRQKYIVPLVEMGMLERTTPNNLKDKNQKYKSSK